MFFFKKEAKHLSGKTVLIFIEMSCTFSDGQNQISFRMDLWLLV